MRKLNGVNYVICHCNIQFALEEAETLESLNHKFIQPKNNGHQVHRDVKVYNSWKCMNIVARVPMSCLKQDGIIRQFNQYGSKSNLTYIRS